jgi:hypothetical protein
MAEHRLSAGQLTGVVSSALVEAHLELLKEPLLLAKAHEVGQGYERRVAPGTQPARVIQVAYG